MKLVITVVHDRDKNKITEALLRSGFKFTKVASTGGFLREGNVTLLIGVESNELERLIQLISDSCKTREQFVNVLPPDAAPVGTFMPSPVKVLVGGAVCFVMDVERFERF
ncbi:MAG TPA: cyclic-di-AMP receptor [Chthonomonadaceae bacterium]|nr:cyclic-di-AMP receptor [Chthonomonadaceae bacterium]